VNLNNNAKKRETWVDVAKLIGIIAIVYGHTIQIGITCQYVYSFHVPLFFFLQGVVFSISCSETKSFSKYLKHKAYTLLLPYLCFSAVSTLIIFIVSRFISIPQTDIFSSIPHVILSLIFGKCEANDPLWFLPCLFVQSILVYGLIKCCSRCKNRVCKISLLLIVAILSSIILYITEEFTNIKFLPWKIDAAIHMIPFFVVGYIFKEYGLLRKLFDARIWIKIIIIVVFIGSGAILGLLNGKSNYLGNYYDNVFLMYVSALLSCLGYCIIAFDLTTVSILPAMGQKTLSILLMHKFPIVVFQYVITPTKILLNEPNILVGLIVTIVSIGACLVANWILERIAPFSVGKRLKKI